MYLSSLRGVLKESLKLFPNLKRNYGITAVMLQKTPSDPIQKLFVEKIREYSKKSQATGGKLVDATAETEKQMKDELEKLEKQYGGGTGIDMTQFPTFKFQDPEIEPINMEQQQ